jgi:hypothetical protein
MATEKERHVVHSLKQCEKDREQNEFLQKQTKVIASSRLKSNKDNDSFEFSYKQRSL